MNTNIKTIAKPETLCGTLRRFVPWQLCAGFIAFAATSVLPADDVALPLPAVRWDPIESDSAIPNTGNKQGFDNLTNDTLVLRRATTNAINTSTPVENLVTENGTGPHGNGRAIDFSSNASMGGAPVVNDSVPDNATPISGFVSGDGFSLNGATALTFTAWYKLDSAFPGSASPYVTLYRFGGNMGVVWDGTGRFMFGLAADTTNAGGSDYRIWSGNHTLLTRPSTWIFIAGTWDGSNGATAVYGGTEELNVSRLNSGVVNVKGKINNAASLNLGFHNLTSEGRTFDGQLADLRFYTTVLSLEQLEKIRSGGDSSTVTSYLPTVKNWIDTSLANDYTDAKIDALTAVAASNGAANERLFHIAAAAARLWLLGGKTETAYADKALYILKAQRNQRALTGSSWRIGFQAKFSFAEAYGILLENGYAHADFNDAFKTDMKAMASDSLGPSSDTSDNNAGAFSSAGTTRALTIWPELDSGNAWSNYIKAQWASWTTRHDTSENSLNYNKVFLAYSIHIANNSSGVSALDTAAMNADLAHDGTLAMVTRWRDQVAGSGQMPAYGDDGNGTPMAALHNWPANFEWAAKQWNDPTFRWAAHTSWGLSRNSTTREPLVLFLLTYADEWADLEMEPAKPQTGAMLQTRNTALDPREPDKIILAPSRDSGAPFVVAEAHSHGWHSHIEQAGSITHYEHNNTVFLYGLGYNNRTSDQASMVLINPASQTFPWRGYPQNDVWYEAAIPTDRFPEITDSTHPLYQGGGHRLLNRPLWRVEQHHPTDSGFAWLSDYRLVAADGTETSLNSLTNASGWGSGVNATLAIGPTGAANTALRFDIEPQLTQDGSTFITLPSSQALNMGIDPVTHPYVKFWWKVSVPALLSGRNPDDQILAHRQDVPSSDGYSYDGAPVNGAIAWLQPFAPTTTAANVETDANGRYGSFTMDGYFTVGTKLTRRIVQLDDGTLVVLDTLLPGKDADGRNAGPVWQLDSSAAPVQVASGVYDATGFFNSKRLARGTDHLLVVMEQSPGRTFGSVQPPDPLWANTTPYATYAKQTLREGVSVSFVTVFVPNDGSTGAAALASGVRIQRNDANSVNVYVDGDGGQSRLVSFGADDTWSVTNADVPQAATITLGHLMPPWDGEPKPVTVTTNPAGLSTVVFYGEERSLTAPTEIGSYPVVAQITQPGYHGETTGTLTIRPPSATIMEQPLSRLVLAGETVTFSVLASGSEPITYQWQKSTDNITFTDIAATGTEFTIANVQASDVGWYRVIVTNHLGSDTSVHAELAILPAAFPAPTTDGYGAGATGGGDGPNILVSSESDLRDYAALEIPATLTVRGNITLTNDIVVGSDKTIQGIDGNATISGGLQIGPGANNVIVRGLNISNPATDGTGIIITGATDVHVSHVSIFDTEGPLVSIDETSDSITLAWSELYYTGNTGVRSAMIAGVSSTTSGPSHVSLHHNYWRDAAQDMPLATNSNIHFYNNYFSATGNLSTIEVSHDAQVFLEYDFFSNVNDPWLVTGTNAWVCANHIDFQNTVPSGTSMMVTGTDLVFTPDYSYLVQPTGGLAALITANAGNTAGASSAAPITPAALTISGTEGAVPDSVSFTLTSSLIGAQAVAYQWRLNNRSLDGETNSSITVDYALQDLSGAYVLEATLTNGDLAVSNPKYITIGAPVPPQITRQPHPSDGPGQAVTEWPVDLGDNTSIFIEATGDPVLKYQWQKRQRYNATLWDNISGANYATLNLGNVTIDDGAVYRVTVVNNSGTVTSTEFKLIVYNKDDPVSIGGSRDGGGGGGALSLWALAACAFLAIVRFGSRMKR